MILTAISSPIRRTNVRPMAICTINSGSGEGNRLWSVTDICAANAEADRRCLWIILSLGGLVGQIPWTTLERCAVSVIRGDITDNMSRAKKLVEDPQYRTSHSIAYDWYLSHSKLPDYEFEILGKLISKKNSYAPLASGKGFYKTEKINNANAMVSLQIPPEIKGLRLENPHIMLEVQMPKKSWRSDRDNGYTFLQDCLVAAQVILDDSVNHCNGYITLVPVVEASDYKCRLRIWENEG